MNDAPLKRDPAYEPPPLLDGTYPTTVPGLVAIVSTPGQQDLPLPPTVAEAERKCEYTQFLARTCQCHHCTGRPRVP
jgi:hypothetical protein